MASLGLQVYCDALETGSFCVSDSGQLFFCSQEGCCGSRKHINETTFRDFLVTVYKQRENHDQKFLIGFHVLGQNCVSTFNGEVKLP